MQATASRNQHSAAAWLHVLSIAIGVVLAGYFLFIYEIPHYPKYPDLHESAEWNKNLAVIIGIVFILLGTAGVRLSGRDGLGRRARGEE